ncbi:MAG: hypothetical protein JW809_20230 [Pirellulales bacterium]|nr:hypothetical protein [Pirellulales bacterium]
MLLRIAIPLFFVLGTLSLNGPGAAAEGHRVATDPFALDGDRNILDEAHFGIVNGKVALGVPYRRMGSVRGLWTPPYVSSDFDLRVEALGEPVATHRYTWRPYCVERTGTARGIAVEEVTMLIPDSRAGLVRMTIKNTTTQEQAVPVAIHVSGTLDRSNQWRFSAPRSQTGTTPRVVDGSLNLEQGDKAIVARGSKSIRWGPSQPRGRASVSLPPSGQVTLDVVYAAGETAEARAACRRIAADPEKAIADARAAYAAQVQRLFEKLPRLESDNPAFNRLYQRSLVHLITNRWDVPTFVLRPYYGTGSINGGCVCEYLWNFGENWEILPLLDAEATRTHIKQFLATDTTKHFAFDPSTGEGFGPWYMVNQEKIVGMIYYYVKNTGDVAFLGDTADGKTILQHALSNATYGDDPRRPVALIDYGPSNAHLELRRGIPYNHVMPDLNGRRYNSFVFAAELADLAGKPAPQLRQRAEQLKAVLKRQLWNEETRWFDFQDEKGKKNARYTVQMFKLLGSQVLDVEEERGLLGHLLSEKEFLSPFGLHGLAKIDLAYDPADIDNGGPGACTCFPPQIAERLFKAGHPDAAEAILKRILWWGDRMPYWGDSLVAERIDYRRDTPLQCTIDGATVAQCVIFGMFGVRAEANGDIRIDPHPPTFAPKVALSGLRLHGRVLNVAVDGDRYEVREGDKVLRAVVGQSVLLRGARRQPESGKRVGVESRGGAVE